MAMASDVGEAVIVVNMGTTVDSSFAYRNGAEKDETNILTVTKRLGFERINTQPELQQNLSLHHWKHDTPCVKNQEKCLQCVIENKASKHSNYFLLALSTHGKIENGELLIEFIKGSQGSRNKFLPLKEVVEFLESCSRLKNKVVILIIEACRSNQNTTDDVGVSSGGAKGPTVVSPDDDQPSYNPVHIPKNFLIVYSTTPYRYAYRDETKGSWFEWKLAEALEKEPNGIEVDFLQLLTRTTGLMSAMEADADKTKPTESNVRPFIVTPGAKCVSCIEHRLTKTPTFILRTM